MKLPFNSFGKKETFLNPADMLSTQMGLGPSKLQAFEDKAVSITNSHTARTLINEYDKENADLMTSYDTFSKDYEKCEKASQKMLLLKLIEINMTEMINTGTHNTSDGLDKLIHIQKSLNNMSISWGTIPTFAPLMESMQEKHLKKILVAERLLQNHGVFFTPQERDDFKKAYVTLKDYYYNIAGHPIDTKYGYALSMRYRLQREISSLPLTSPMMKTSPVEDLIKAYDNHLSKRISRNTNVCEELLTTAKFQRKISVQEAKSKQLGALLNNIETGTKTPIKRRRLHLRMGSAQ